ncbi:DUF3237 domain-containing protein [Pseudooceanicola sp. C21-150M6]|uniref:DUF3237 domain-containing protein n=1 Tax=Pseudooceanicola sp. C21-150M6 TaxID=3434355 RepID=UPI003D7F8901
MSDTLPRPVLTMRLDMGPAKQISGGTGEIRMIYNVRGGEFQGSGLRGVVMPVVGDWVSVKDGSVTMDVRVKLRTEASADILMSYESIADLDAVGRALLTSIPEAARAQHFFRVTPTFDTGAPSLRWLCDMTCFAIGLRFDDAIHYHVYPY